MELSTNRRKVLLGLASATAAATSAAAHASPDSSQVHDPLPAWWQEYELTTKEFCEASRKPGNGNYDTPEMLEINDCRDALEKAISETEPTTLEGAIAQLEFVKEELNQGLHWEQHGPMLDRVVTALRRMA